MEAAAYADNEASRGLLESLGFEREGRLRKHRFVDGEYRDVVVYGLLCEEWETTKLIRIPNSDRSGRSLSAREGGGAQGRSGATDRAPQSVGEA